ncbi:hypothetical protein [Methylobacterium thuringiense]|uniref:Uncharacterized protein n=1 Tax=Methylobacterium thuringiense TaxID=1003091 RepID=A0ABQ4TQY3_9HYPH|nr:hypothetical protein [Methylobacterium thuringiense]GJE57021.1 hypothetical protein EKPJFOCH_3531 [Methylobacterium thuringiense]
MISEARAITQTASPVQRSRSALDAAAHLAAARIEPAFEKHGRVD